MMRLRVPFEIQPKEAIHQNLHEMFFGVNFVTYDNATLHSAKIGMKQCYMVGVVVLNVSLGLCCKT